MQAEIHKKLTDSNIENAHRLEDVLTGNVFGVLRYIPFQKGLKQILLQVVDTDKFICNKIKNIKSDEFTIAFWTGKETGYGEIDLIITVENIKIGIEVKYESWLSGENQLVSYSNLVKPADNVKDGILIILAREKSAKQIYEDNYHKSAFRENKVYLGYLGWEVLLQEIKKMQLNDGLNEYEKLMLKDIEQYLSIKNFDTFEGFGDLANFEIVDENYYRF